MVEGAEIDESGSESEEGLMDVTEAFISHTQSPVIVNPREEAFYHPAASSKATYVPCALTCSLIIISFFDYYQGANRETELLSIGGHLPLERMFAYESIPTA